jgi:hypothetical protein
MSLKKGHNTDSDMNDSPDLRRILKDWPYDPEQDARIVRGDDGRELLQVRTPLGIEQYEMDGRPDGLRPHGMESALEYHTHLLNQAKFSGVEADFGLSPSECSDLFHEGTLYYFRYVRLFQLKDWTRTARDTARNLWAFDLLHRYARREEDQQFRQLERLDEVIVRAGVQTPRAVSINTGVFLVLRRRRSNSQPSMTGSMMSSTMAS